MHLTRDEIEAIEKRVDEGFLRVTGKTWREGDSSSPDTLDSIRQDYPTLFTTEGESK